MGLVAIVPEEDDEVICGVGRYIVVEREPARAAEVAFTLLLRHLARIAREGGVTEFQASVLSENRKMLEVFRHSGLPETTWREGSVVEVRMSLAEED